MDLLLAGYGSSDDESLPTSDHAEHGPDIASTVSNDQKGCPQLEEGKRGFPLEQPGKRQRLDGCSLNSVTAAPRARAESATKAGVTTTLSSSSGGLLPNPLALLEASTEEDRRELVVAAAAMPAARGAVRVRTFPHVVGNFPTVVMLPVQGKDEALDAVYRKVRRMLPDLEPMSADDAMDQAAVRSAGAAGGSGARPTLQWHRGYHISLSRTVPIRHPQIAPLTALLSERLADVNSGFHMSLAGLRCFVNDEGTRSFVSIMVTRGSDQVCALIRQVDAAFAAHGLPTFYEVPLPHVSIGWLPGDQRERIDGALQRLRQPGQEVGASGVQGIEREVCSWQASRAICVVGQREYEVWKPRALV